MSDEKNDQGTGIPSDPANPGYGDAEHDDAVDESDNRQSDQKLDDSGTA